MGTYCEIVGSLTFATEADAKSLYTALRTSSGDDVTVFWEPPPDPEEEQSAATDLVLDGRTLTFAYKGFGGAEEFYGARALIVRTVETRKAIAGRVRVQEGDEDEGASVEYIGLKQAREKSAAKKSTAKKPTAKKPAAKKSSGKKKGKA